MEKVTLTAVEKTNKGYRCELDNGVSFNVGAAFTHIVIYADGGYSHTTRANDSWCVTRHKTAAAAQKAAADSPRDLPVVIELSTWAPAVEQPVEPTAVERVAELHGTDAAELVAARYPSALPLLLDGWTLDGALAHVQGQCDRAICCGWDDDDAPLGILRGACSEPDADHVDEDGVTLRCPFCGRAVHYSERVGDYRHCDGSACWQTAGDDDVRAARRPASREARRARLG